MELREQLTPSASIDRIKKVKEKIIEIENKLQKGLDILKLIADFNDFTHRDYNREYFLTYWNSESIDDFARDAAQPLPSKIENITKEELVEVTTRIMNGDENTKFYLDILSRNLPHPRISNLIFWPENEGLMDDVSAKEMVEKAMSYKPIQL